MSWAFTKTYTKTSTKTKVEEKTSTLPPLQPLSPACLSVLSWNVNGLEDDIGVALRLKAVVAEIRECSADVVCLQEVVSSFRTTLVAQLSSVYRFEDVTSAIPTLYFTMILTKKERIIQTAARREGFAGGASSAMGRDLLIVETKVQGFSTPIRFITSHMESGSEKFEPQSAAIRKQQYEQLLRTLCQESSDRVQIACGDFNLREAEDTAVRSKLKKAGVAVARAVDAYVAAGSPAAARETFKRKITPSMASPITARYDRQVYVDGSGEGAEFSLMANGMRLVGQQDVVGIDAMTARQAGFSTPSDHMGLLCFYHLGGAAATMGGGGGSVVGAGAGSVASGQSGQPRTLQEERALRAEAALKRARVGVAAPSSPIGESVVAASDDAPPSKRSKHDEAAAAAGDADVVFLSSEPSRHSDPDVPWACSICTLLNAPDATQCEACENERK